MPQSGVFLPDCWFEGLFSTAIGKRSATTRGRSAERHTGTSTRRRLCSHVQTLFHIPGSAFELSRKRQARARALGVSEAVNQRTKGVRWNDPTTQTNDGRVATAQSLPDYCRYLSARGRALRQVLQSVPGKDGPRTGSRVSAASDERQRSGCQYDSGQPQRTALSLCRDPEAEVVR